MEDQIFDEQARSEIPFSEGPQEESIWKKILGNKKIAIPAVLGVALVVGVFWYFLRPLPPVTPTSTNVVLLIKGPEQLTSGNEAEYKVVYRNGENADLIGITLEMFYPSGFKFKSAEPSSTQSSGQSFNLPVLKEGKDGEVVIRGKLTGAAGENKEIRAKLHYRLSNFNSEFIVDQSFSTNVLPPNLSMDINGPVDVVNGQDTTFNVTFTNVTIQDFDNLALSMVYPEGFSFTGSNPSPSKSNNYWTIQKLPSGSSMSVEITGSFTGDPSQDKLVRADLGQVINNSFAPQIATTATFKIIPSSLSIVVSAQPANYVHLGDTINYKIDYANQGSIGLSSLVITLDLDSPVLDFARLSARDAIVSGHVLTWKSATMPSLAVLSPNETGRIEFSIPVKTSSPTNLKNQTIKALAAISSNEISKPTRAADFDIKLVSAMTLDVVGDYVSGAAPMKVGEPTLFAMTFILSNLSNDVSDATVVASLPLAASTWKNIIVPESEKDRLKYDSNSGKITWKIGNLPAFTGKFTPALRVVFQLEVVPAEFDRGRDITLLTDVQATGIDSFVNVPLQTEKIKSITTSTINDDVMNRKGTTVQ